MQEQKDEKVINIQPSKASPPGKVKLLTDEQKLVSLIAKIIVDKTLNDNSTIHPGADSSPE